ncbi:MAG: hypothetical protein WC324_05320 [Candidatus Omnitrophota bacterium]|jgi:transposase
MKARERKLARELRKQGWSLREITRRVKCSKSAVSNWIRDIPLNDEQIANLKSNQDKGRANAANHPNSPKQVWAKIRKNISDSAGKETASKYTPDALKTAGIALYWGEGGKAGHNIVNFSNSDPGMVRLMMKFFKDICNVDGSKFRGAVHIHPHLDINKSERYWSKVSGIPLKQFHKTNIAVSKASKGKRDTLPLGTFKIVICDTRLQSRIKGWIEGIKKWSD